MATIDLKLKSYDELQFEIMRLNTDNYLKQQQITQLINNWNELEEWLNKVVKITANIDEKMTCKNVLDKMKELNNENGGDHNE